MYFFVLLLFVVWNILALMNIVYLYNYEQFLCGITNENKVQNNKISFNIDKNMCEYGGLLYRYIFCIFLIAVFYFIFSFLILLHYLNTIKLFF